MVSDPAERLEVELVRALETAHSTGNVLADVPHASPFQWANACHDLWAQGRIDLTEFSVRLLHVKYPALEYLASLKVLFDAMPRDPPLAVPFRDEPTAEIQIVRRSEFDTVLLCFCAAEGTLGHPLNFVHQWLGRVPTSLVYIKDLRNLRGGCGFPTLGPDRVSAIKAFRRIAAELNGKKIYTFGVSAGGYAALYYGLELGALAVLSLGGATDYTPDFVHRLGPVGKRYLNLCERAPDYLRNLRESCALAADQTRVLIAYSSGNPGARQQAERLWGLPNVELIGVDSAQHNVIDPLIRKRDLLPLLHHLLSQP